MHFDQLWTARDEHHKDQLLDALAREDLLSACLAIEGSDEDNEANARATIAAWGDEVAEYMAQAECSAHDAMVEVLVDRRSFRGDKEDYYHPRNSHISTVLERRQGLPILLSTVWLVVGQAAEIAIEGIGMPGHFLVQVEDVLLDPFAQGKQLSIADCKATIAQLSQGTLPWEDRYLNPTPMADITERILHNLINAFAQSEDAFGLYRILRLLSNLHPGRLDLLLQQGRIAEGVGNVPVALQAYQAFLAQAPKGKGATQIQALIDTLQAKDSFLQ